MKKAVCLMVLFGILTLALSGQTIIVTSPAAGNTWCVGGTYTITWTKSGNMDARVLIRLKNGNSVLLTISSDTANSGTFPWTIPAQVAPGQYYVRVKTLNNAVTGDSETFSIAPALPPPPPSSLTVTAPNGGEKWAVHSAQVIKWNTVNVAGKVRLELVRHQGQMLGIIANSLDASAGSFPWGAGNYGFNQDAPPGDYLVRVRSLANFQIVDESDSPFTIKFVMTPHQPPVQLYKPDLVACTETSVYVPLKTLGWFHVYVRNIGKGTARAPFVVETFMAGHTPQHTTINTDLTPGETRWVTNLADSSRGEATIGFMVNADSNNDVAETNEENNRANGLLLIEEGNPISNSPIRCSDGSTL